MRFIQLLTIWIQGTAALIAAFGFVATCIANPFDGSGIEILLLLITAGLTSGMGTAYFFAYQEYRKTYLQ
jgi:hypothetical protein